MKTPLIADNRGDILVFESLSDASSYLEPIDIRNGEYVFYDAEGNRLQAIIGVGGRISFSPLSPPAGAVEELRASLEKYLVRVGCKEQPQPNLIYLLEQVSKWAKTK